jgi:hypothetical protein
MRLPGRLLVLKGFKGSRKSTPFAAQIAAEDCAKKAQEHGMKSLEVEVCGPGSGRESALRALPGCRLHDHVDPRRDADPAQRLPSAQEAPRLISSFECRARAFFGVPLRFLHLIAVTIGWWRRTEGQNT